VYAVELEDKGGQMNLRILSVLVLMCLMASSLGDGLSVPKEGGDDPYSNGASDPTLRAINNEQDFLPYSSQIYDQTSNPATPWFDMQGQDDLKKPKADDEIKEPRKSIKDKNSPFDFEFPYLSNLNIELENAEYYENLSLTFILSNEVIQKLRNNGLVVLNHTLFNGYQGTITSFMAHASQSAIWWARLLLSSLACSSLDTRT
jgi:hypothetical protein